MKHENETHNFLSKTIYFGHNNKNGSVQLHSVLDSLRGRRWKGKGNLGARESVRPPSRVFSRPNSLPLPFWSSRRQESREIHPQIKISQPKFLAFFRLGIQAKRFSSIDCHCFPISIDKTHLIANDFFRVRFLSIDYSGSSGMQLHPDLHRRYFERVVDLNPEKMGAYRPGQYQPSEEDFKPGFKGKIRVF